MGIFDSSTETTISPYGPTRAPLDALIGRIGGLGADPWEVFGGDEVAGFTPQQIQALQEMGAFGGPGGAGADITGQITGAGEDLLGSFGSGVDLLERGADRGPVQAGRADLGYAADVASNPFMDQMIQSAIRDVTRGFSESTMPGIAADAAQRGHLGSSRRGAYEAISERGAMDRAGDISAGLRGSAYQTGLGMAGDQAQQQTAADLGFRSEELNRAGGMLGAGGTGANLLGTGYGMGRTNIADKMTAGGIEQNQMQQVIDSMMRKFYEEQNLPYQQAGAEMGLLMGPGQAFSTQTQDQSMSPIGAGLGMVGNLAGSWLAGGGGNPFKGMFGGGADAAGGGAGGGGGIYGGWGGGGGDFDPGGTFGGGWDFGFPSVFDQVGMPEAGGTDPDWWKRGF